ncbi:hypothetical protein Clacol_000549 [Clathrus columnatus]|uniref:RanBD1 domain-containing protein n=1 Tax=Clathrus columnatus TaxID=1419009 RepID=A0AAV5A150_9AGAM|nr:hypothetical protein Clacol_000549 [Clathrus columnatus]
MTPSTDDNTPKPPTPTPAPNPTLTKYYTELRALNISFSRAVNDAVEVDPLVDLSVITEKYRTFREGIQKERDSNEAKQTSKTTTSISSFTPSTTSSAFTAPALPSTTFTFGSSSNPNPASQTTASAPSTKSQSWSKFTPPSTDKALTPSFSFGTPSQTSSSSGFFVFGGSSTEGASGSKAATTATTTTAAAPDKPSSSPTTTQNLFKVQSTPITPGFSSFLTPSSSLTTTSSSQPSTSTISESSSSTGNLFGAANKGNMGNPLGFSFGNTPKFPAFPSTTSTTTVNTTIGTGTGTTTETTSNGLLDVPTKDEVSTEGDESASENAQTDHNNNKENQYDKDGAGEEEEETQFETKSKAYMNVTGADGKKAWSPVGTGQLKLKKQKEGTKRRLLMRNSSNGKVIINTLLVPGFKLTVEGKTISFIVPNAEGTADFWKLRLSTESDAKAWEAKISEK